MKVESYPILTFVNSSDWEKWLNANHETAAGVWLRFFKKGSGVVSLVYADALEVALCFGWIDSQAKKYDEKSYLQKFTPRRSKSIWSKINTEHIVRLIKEAKMRPAGLRQVEEAKKDGRWDAAYHSPSRIELPHDFISKLKANKKAYDFFKTLNKSNTYAIAWRLQTAKKPETKERREAIIIEKLEKGEKFHD